MDVETVKPLVARLGFVEQSVQAINGGWASWTFDLAAPDGTPWILRIARTAEIDAAHRREERLLPLLCGAVPFAVPLPEHRGEWCGRRYLAYRKLAGRSLRSGDRDDGVAAMLRGLHSVPVDPAATALGTAAAGAPAAWRADYVQLRERFENEAIGRLDAALAGMVCREYDRFLGGPMDFTPTLVHRDLGVEHILVDPRAGTPTGMIDFETATIGDPAIDFVGLLAAFGDAATAKIVASYGFPIDADRLRFYWWLGALHALAYGIENDDEEIVRDGIDGLAGRLSAL